MRAGDLQGKEVHSGNVEVGTIEAVVIEGGTAMALLDPDNDFVKTENKFLVPLSELQMSGKRRVITSLSKSDFEQTELATAAAAATPPTDMIISPTGQTATTTTDRSTSGATSTSSQAQGTSTTDTAQSTTSATSDQLSAKGRTSTDQSATTASTDTSPAQSQTSAAKTSEQSSSTAASGAASTSDTRKTDEEQLSATGRSSTTLQEPSLSPTGQTSADMTPSADPALISAARAVRRMLDDDPELASVFVVVVPENGKIVLRGSVKDDKMMKSIEQKAQDAAMGKEIDNQMKAGNK